MHSASVCTYARIYARTYTHTRTHNRTHTRTEVTEAQVLQEEMVQMVLPLPVVYLLTGFINLPMVQMVRPEAEVAAAAAADPEGLIAVDAVLLGVVDQEGQAAAAAVEPELAVLEAVALLH